MLLTTNVILFHNELGLQKTIDTFAEAVTKVFAEVGYEGNLNYEAGNFVRRAPVALRLESATYMAKIGKHLKERVQYYKDSLVK